MKTLQKKDDKSANHRSTTTFFGKEGGFFSPTPEREVPFFGPFTVQPELLVGQPNDKYEQEAEQMAEQVSRMPMNNRIGTQAMPMDAANPKRTAQQHSHTVSKPVIQRLVREPYPWDGIVTNDNAQVFDPNIDYRRQTRPRMLMHLNNGDRVVVLEFSRPRYLLVRTEAGVEGYIDHNHIDDPTSSRMESLVGRELRWTASDLAGYEEPQTGGDAASDFREWARAESEAAAPSIDDSSILMNCWEVILLTAYQLGEVSWDWIHTLYTTRDELTPSDLIENQPPTAIIFNNEGEPVNLRVQRGDLVFFNNVEHVTLATGEGQSVYSFWPVLRNPNHSYRGMRDEIRIEDISFIRTRIAEIDEGVPIVTYARPAWL